MSFNSSKEVFQAFNTENLQEHQDQRHKTDPARHALITEQHCSIKISFPSPSRETNSANYLHQPLRHLPNTKHSYNKKSLVPLNGFPTYLWQQHEPNSQHSPKSRTASHLHSHIPESQPIPASFLPPSGLPSRSSHRSTPSPISPKRERKNTNSTFWWLE